MPISKYDKHYGGKAGSAAKAKRSMEQQYGKDKGEEVFYATANKRKRRGMTAGRQADALKPGRSANA